MTRNINAIGRKDTQSARAHTQKGADVKVDGYLIASTTILIARVTSITMLTPKQIFEGVIFFICVLLSVVERSLLSCRELDDEREVVGLDGSVGCRSVSLYLAASCATVDYHISALGVKLDADRLHRCAALVCSVAGIYVNVQGPEAKRTMVARGIAERLHFAPAMSAGKAAVIFTKTLFFHLTSLQRPRY